MDWSKIKTTLIIALVLANLALAYVVVGQKAAREDGTFTRSFQTKALTLLKENQIQVDPDVRLKKTKLNSLRVKYEAISEEELNQVFFHNEGLLNQPNLGLVKLSLGKESLTIYNGRRLYYQNNLDFSKEKMTREEAQEKALEFLQKRRFKSNDLQLVQWSPWQGGYQLIYKKVHDKVLVETTYTKFYLDKNGVHSMERLWLNVLKASEHALPLASPSKALLSLLDEEGPLGPQTVVDISPCYYFNPQKQGYIEDITKAQQGRAIPAWRIQLDSGQEVIVDGLS